MPLRPTLARPLPSPHDPRRARAHLRHSRTQAARVYQRALSGLSREAAVLAEETHVRLVYGLLYMSEEDVMLFGQYLLARNQPCLAAVLCEAWDRNPHNPRRPHV